MSVGICLGSPFMASAPPHSQSLPLPHLHSKDHHFLGFQRPFLHCPHPLQSWLKSPPRAIGRAGGGALFDPAQLLALQPLGKKVPFVWASLFFICTMGVIWYAEGVIPFEFPHFSLDT